MVMALVARYCAAGTRLSPGNSAAASAAGAPQCRCHRRYSGAVRNTGRSWTTCHISARSSGPAGRRGGTGDDARSMIAPLENRLVVLGVDVDGHDVTVLTGGGDHLDLVGPDRRQRVGERSGPGGADAVGQDALEVTGLGEVGHERVAHGRLGWEMIVDRVPSAVWAWAWGNTFLSLSV